MEPPEAPQEQPPPPPGAAPAAAAAAAVAAEVGDPGPAGGRPKCFVIVYNISKRHNIGTLLRSCTAFGVSQVGAAPACSRASGATRSLAAPFRRLPFWPLLLFTLLLSRRLLFGRLRLGQAPGLAKQRDKEGGELTVRPSLLSPPPARGGRTLRPQRRAAARGRPQLQPLPPPLQKGLPGRRPAVQRVWVAWGGCLRASDPLPHHRGVLRVAQGRAGCGSGGAWGGGLGGRGGLGSVRVRPSGGVGRARPGAARHGAERRKRAGWHPAAPGPVAPRRGRQAGRHQPAGRCGS